MEFHPIADIFPLLEGEAFDALCRDVEEKGLMEPIWLYDDKILDGRNRWRACQETGTETRYRQYEGTDPVGFVVSLNVQRRHLDESQRAMISARIATMERGDNQHAPIGACSQEEAAELLSVARRSVQRAAKVLDEGTPELIAAVDSGEIKVSAAAVLAELPKTSQNSVLEGVKAISDGRMTAKQARAAVDAVQGTGLDSGPPHIIHNSGQNEWYTPPEYIRKAVEVMGGIDCDPASSEIANRIVGADTYFTAEQDGLAQTWRGRVWMNPPYSQPLIADFCRAAVEKLDSGEIMEAMVLVNNATETEWFQCLCRRSAVVYFPDHRICFIDPNGNKQSSPLQGQAILYLGDDPDRFIEVFSGQGVVLRNG